MSVRSELWEKILETLDDTLQLGFYEEARYVSEVVQSGTVLRICVPPRSAEADRAYRFLSKPENINRLLILAKRLHTGTPGIDSIEVVQELSAE